MYIKVVYADIGNVKYFVHHDNWKVVRKYFELLGQQIKEAANVKCDGLPVWKIHKYKKIEIILDEFSSEWQDEKEHLDWIKEEGFIGKYACSHGAFEVWHQAEWIK